MIKPILLSISLATFLTSLFFTIAGLTNKLQENILTGAVINTNQLTSYSAITLIISFIISTFLLILILKK